MDELIRLKEDNLSSSIWTFFKRECILYFFFILFVARVEGNTSSWDYSVV